MTDNRCVTTPPRRLLLATDLTSRGDRALDRAVQLAREWHADLHIVHAVVAAPPAVPVGVDAEAYLQRAPDPVTEAMRLLRRDLGSDELGAQVHIEQEAIPAQAILAVAEREDCDLIVLGESRPRLVGPLGESTVEHVVRKSPVSVLAVRDRPRGPYRQVLVGTDFTDEAQQALAYGAGLFPQASITLLHAYSLPYSSVLEHTAEGRDWSATERAKLDAQIDGADLPAARKASIRKAVEAGPPGPMLRRYGLDHAADLTVIGAHPRGMLFDAVIGSSRRIIDALPGDILVVRARRRAAD